MSIIQMETLQLHIEYLLTRHDCVIVPGLGALIATETEASINLEAGVINPRRREISFNGSVVTDDGLLAHSIARREHLSYEDAHRRLCVIVDKMKADLSSEGEVSLGMTGRLIMTGEGLVCFQPRQSRIQADILPPVALFNKTEEEHEDAVDRSIRVIEVPADHYVFTVSKRAVHAAAMLIMILTIGISLLIPINHDQEQKASVLPIPAFNLPAASSDTVTDSSSGFELSEQSE